MKKKRISLIVSVLVLGICFFILNRCLELREQDYQKSKLTKSFIRHDTVFLDKESYVLLASELDEHYKIFVDTVSKDSFALEVHMYNHCYAPTYVGPIDADTVITLSRMQEIVPCMYVQKIY